MGSGGGGEGRRGVERGGDAEKIVVQTGAEDWEAKECREGKREREEEELVERVERGSEGKWVERERKGPWMERVRGWSGC